MSNKNQETEKLELPEGGLRGIWAEVLELRKRVKSLESKKPEAKAEIPKPANETIVDKN